LTTFSLDGPCQKMAKGQVVVPAEAGTQIWLNLVAGLGTGFRRCDDNFSGKAISIGEGWGADD